MELDYHVVIYDNADEENPILFDIVKDNLLGPIVALDVDGNYIPGGMRTDQEFHTKGIKEVDKLLSWVHEYCLISASKFAGRNSNVPKLNDYYDSESKLCKHFSEDSFKIDQCWAVVYNDSGGVVPHNHFPYSLSFVYYVKTPNGCSPLILDGETIDVNEGELLFWHGNVEHSVLPSNSKDRCVIVGNILYTP